MDSLSSIIFAILFPVCGLTAVAALIYLIVKFVRAKSQDEKVIDLSGGLILRIYLYLVSFITLAIAVYGGSTLIKASSSYLLGIPFSYDLYGVNIAVPADSSSSGVYYYEEKDIPTCYQGEEITVGEQTVCFDDNTRKQDILNGATLLVSMILIFAVHQWGIKKLEPSGKNNWLKKIYTFASLFVYSVVGIIIIPTSIYQLIYHFLYRVNDITLSGAPGSALGVLIFAVPLWIYFLVKVTKMKEED